MHLRPPTFETFKIEAWPMKDLIRWFADIRLGDVGQVGGKNASLGEMYSMLSSSGVRVPDGFALTADAYRRVIQMLEMLKLALVGAKRNGRHVGICGEAPANYPEIARYLAGHGIDSISVPP